jgi:hypothetical protein
METTLNEAVTKLQAEIEKMSVNLKAIERFVLHASSLQSY